LSALDQIIIAAVKDVPLIPKKLRLSSSNRFAIKIFFTIKFFVVYLIFKINAQGGRYV
jgi:hypothetical protein